MVEGQLQLDLLAGEPEEVVRRLERAVADDRQLAPELEAERLVERPAALGSVMRTIVCRKVATRRILALGSRIGLAPGGWSPPSKRSSARRVDLVGVSGSGRSNQPMLNDGELAPGQAGQLFAQRASGITWCVRSVDHERRLNFSQPS